MENKERFKVVIDRQTWCRRIPVPEGYGYRVDRTHLAHLSDGAAEGGARLLTNQNGKCCLGFWCSQYLKLDDNEILGASRPDDLPETETCSSWMDNAMTANDTTWRSEADQERRVREAFAQGGFDVEFIN